MAFSAGVGMKRLEKIAVIGAWGQFPQAEGLKELDRVFSNRVDGIGKIPRKRIQLQQMDPQKEYIESGYLEDIDRFDYGFFGISPKEASCMDPQHRLALETACKTIESAGYGLSDVAETNTAVIVGCGDTHYSELFEDKSGYAIVGAMVDTLAGRISYLLDLRGESSVVSTSCSSSLFGLYDACVRLSQESCEAALVGGVYIDFNIRTCDELSGDSTTLGLAASDGRCKAFDDSADGINTCESCAFVFLKRLEDAERDGDHILAVISAAEANQDGGRSNSFSSPSVMAQAELLARTWKDHQINPEEIGYFEGHGTGTKIGDPIEIDGIRKAFLQFTEKKHVCPIGSLKSNYGHPGPVAGLASVLKGILSLNLGKKYPLRTFNIPNRMINFADSPVYPAVELEEWEDGHKVFAINCFGISGTNVHVVLENAKEIPKVEKQHKPWPVKLSAATEEQFYELKNNMLKILEEEKSLKDVALTLDLGRDDYPCRFAREVASVDSFIAQLKTASPNQVKEPPAVVLLCSGSRDYSEDTIEQLRDKYSVFCETFDFLSPHCKEKVGRNAIVDLAFLKQAAAWGIKPDYLLGTGRGMAAVAAFSNPQNENMDEVLQQFSGQDFQKGKFLQYMKNLVDSENRGVIVLEVGGQGVMTDVLKEDAYFQDIKILQGDAELLVSSSTIAELYELGLPIDWKVWGQNIDYNKRLLPPTPFAKTYAWPSRTWYGNTRQSTKKQMDKPQELKEYLRQLWEETLEIPTLSGDEDFFDLGANSLMAMNILEGIKEKTGIELAFEDLYEYSTLNRLCDYLDSDVIQEKKEEFAMIPKAERQEKMLTSGNQSRMLFLLEEGINNAVYNMPIWYRLEGDLDENLFCRCLAYLVDRHEILRTVYKKEAGIYYQTILDNVDFKVEVKDVSDWNERDVKDWILGQAAKAFDLFNEIPVRCSLLKLEEGKYYWFMNVHHIAADGWSTGIFSRELEVLYQQGLEEKELFLETLPIQYVDYAVHEQQIMKNGRQKELAYWKEELKDVTGILDFPVDRKRPPMKQYNGFVYEFSMDPDLANRMDRYCKKMKMTSFMFLESAFVLLLRMYSGANDICVGVPMANRNYDEVKQMVGFFANTVIVRSKLEEGESVKEFLNRNRLTILKVYENANLPFEEIAGNVIFQRNPAYSPLFQYSFAMQNFKGGDPKIGNLHVISEDSVTRTVKFDMLLTMYPEGKGYGGMVEYDTDLFSADYVKEIVINFEAVIESILEDDQNHIDGLAKEKIEVIMGTSNPQDSLFL